MAAFSSSKELKSFLDAKDRLAYPLLRWILSSCRAHIAPLSPAEQIKGVGTTCQFLMLSAAPTKEKKFALAKQSQGSMWAYHGSGWGNWHSILRNGLKNYSGTALMSTGAVYGNGIYLAKDSNTSLGYAKAMSGWPKSKMGGSGIQCLSLVELINANYQANPYYVIPNEDHIVTRYLFVYNPSNTHVANTAASLVIPTSPYTRYLQQSGK